METNEERETGLPAIASGALIDIAEQAEKRVTAIIKIKKVALMVTNRFDWTNQQDRPYLQVSGSEKIANLFNISWRIDEPRLEFEDDGHFTYTYKGEFSLAGRTIEVEGSRSSKDPFFKKYDWIPGPDGNKVKTEKPISAIDKRDVKMAALTNLLGNGISRILGIRNLQWSDLREFAGIKKEDVQGIEYKKGGEKPSIQEPLKKQPPKEEPPKTDALYVVSPIINVLQKDGKKSDGKPWTLYTVVCEMGGKQKNFSTFSKTIGEAALKAKGTPAIFEIHYKDKGSQYPGEIIEDGLIPVEPPDEQDAQT